MEGWREEGQQYLVNALVCAKTEAEGRASG